MKKELLVLLLAAVAAPLSRAKTISVDPRDPTALHTLREAAPLLKPGDTLWLVPGSGPYREELSIPASGRPGEPIVVEGNGNEVTGFDPLPFHGGVARPPVPYPFVLRHLGKRVPEETAGQFGESVTYDASANRLTLAPGASPDGWEISTRKFAVRIRNVSNQSYRHLVASGSLNDGFNLHGEGEALSFVEVTGCQNLDEGFSAHETIQCEIRDSRFFENDNGILSGQNTTTRMENVDLRDNLGIGLGFNGKAVVQARGVRVWNNGMVQLLLRNGVTADFRNVRVFRNPYRSRRWVSYQESARRINPVDTEIGREITWQGDPPGISGQTAPTSPEPSPK